MLNRDHPTLQYLHSSVNKPTTEKVIKTNIKKKNFYQNSPKLQQSRDDLSILTQYTVQ